MHSNSAESLHTKRNINAQQHEYLLDPQRSDKYRRYMASLACSVISVVFFLFMGVLNFTQDNLPMTVVLLACIFVCTLAVLLQLATGSAGFSAALLCITHIILSWHLISLGGPNMGSLMWSFVYPHAFMLWLGLRRGTILSLFFWASIFMLTFSPLAAYLPAKFENAAAVRYLITLAALSCLAFFSEYIRDRLQKKLIYSNQQIQNTALSDPLTGLGNRLAFEQHLKREYARFLRHGDDFAMIMGDIDHFKTINDRKGHAVGDAVLQHTAELIASHIRKQDAIFRWGGEEFIVTLSGIQQYELVKLAEELRLSIAETPCPYQDDKIYYTMSFGAYSCSMLESASEAMDKTDRLLYAAKRAGRNKVMSNDNLY